MRNTEEEQAIAFFREAITRYAQHVCPHETWGNRHSDNEVMAMEIRNAMELNEELIHFLEKRTTEEGFEVWATIGPSITNLTDLRRAIYFILGQVTEDFLLVQCTVDETSLKYWLVTGSFAGSSAHGHIGTIRMNKEDIIHLNPEFFQRYTY